ncbi:P-loop ATPase, Sll1717 family [Roseicyclus persicicus]
MKIRDFDFGAEDARNLSLLSEEEKQLFLESFVIPEAFDIERFFDGRKYFVYGGKGSGKTALLQYIRILCERDLEAFTHFYYFQSTFSDKQLARFRKTLAGRPNEEIVNDSVFSADEDARVFWRLFLLTQISRLLRRRNMTGRHAETFFKSIEAARLISQSEQNRKRYPSLETFQLELSKNPSLTLQGSFAEAGPSDLETYIEIAEDALEEVYLANSPIFVFIDEMEIYKRGDDGDRIQVAAISSLIRAIRDFSERFEAGDIRIVAAIRREIVDEVAEVKYEVHRIVRDRGVELDWPKSVKSGTHPLERTILNRMAVQDPTIDTSAGITTNEINIVKARYFQQGYPTNLIDKTWYRPRDMALLFELAQNFDGSMNFFRRKTLTENVLPDLGTRLWQDAKSGLGVKFDPIALSGIDKLLRGGRRNYTRPQWLQRIALLRDQDDYVATLEDSGWDNVLQSLYRVGVIFYSATETGYKNFYFRGDPMPTFTSDFNIGVHRTLWNELALH